MKKRELGLTLGGVALAASVIVGVVGLPLVGVLFVTSLYGSGFSLKLLALAAAVILVPAICGVIALVTSRGPEGSTAGVVFGGIGTGLASIVLLGAAVLHVAGNKEAEPSPTEEGKHQCYAKAEQATDIGLACKRQGLSNTCPAVGYDCVDMENFEDAGAGGTCQIPCIEDCHCPSGTKCRKDEPFCAPVPK